MKDKKAILCLLIAAVFLLPLTGNSAMAAQYNYYFNHHDANIVWETNPGYMVDGNENTYASTTIDGDVQLCDDNSYSGPPPSIAISKVEIRAKAKADGPSVRGYNITLTPIFRGTTRGNNYTFEIFAGPTGHWSQWFDITNDPSAPGTWDWSYIDSLDIEVKAGINVSGTVYCSMIQIQVTS